jgi:hypothetical protein
MSESRTDADGGQHWSYRRENTVGIWTITDFEALLETEAADAEQHYQQTTMDESMTATVVVLEEPGAIGSELQEHITETWSQLAQTASGITRTAYVADGIAAMAVKSKVTAPETELESFSSVDHAVSWADQA